MTVIRNRFSKVVIIKKNITLDKLCELFVELKAGAYKNYLNLLIK